MKLIIIIILPILLLSTGINQALLDIETQQHHYILQDSINVTLGEPFRIILPSIQLKAKPSNYTVYEIDQESFLSVVETPQKHYKPSQMGEQKRKKVSEDTFNCKINLAKMSLMRSLSKINEPNSVNYFSYFTNKKYAFVFSRNLIYSLDPTNMQVTVFYFNDQNLKKLSSIRLPLMKNTTKNKASIGCSSDETKIYIFSSGGMWQIETKTYLTQVSTINPGTNGFNSRKNRVDDLFHGAHGKIFAVNKLRAVYIIEENDEKQYQEISTFQNKQLAPQDVVVYGQYLYVLDLHNGIYIYKIFGDGKATQHDWIQLKTSGNMRFLVRERTILVNFNDENGNKIVQINYDLDNKKAQLVRYYKDDAFILSMATALVQVSSQDMHSESSSEQFLFVVGDSGQIQAYPFNIDPRTINSLHNGVKMYVDGSLQIRHVMGQNYILITSQGIHYVQIKINKPQLICEMEKSTGHSFYQMEFKANISSCQHYDHQIIHKRGYNSYCQLLSTYTINVNDPQRSQFLKVVLYGMVLTVILAFIVGLLCLIEWRNNKLSLLGRLKDQIIRFRDRHRKIQPFVEEQPTDKKQVEFQLPYSQPIDDIVE